MDRTERIEKMAASLVPWYKACARQLPWREDTEPYHVWVSEIMLQQTRIETVIPYYLRFMQELPDVRALAGADPERLHKLWEGLGYYSRVRNLQTAAKQITEKFNGNFPDTFEDIRSLQGVGDYTAGAIASICFDLPCPAVDGNVLRVLSRLTGDDRPVNDEKLKKEVRAELAESYPPSDRGVFTQAIMELGETVCKANGTPDCAVCPCREFCKSAAGGWANLPVITPKKERKKERLTLLLLHCGSRLAIRKRPEKGLLAGMWELPNVPGKQTGNKVFLQAEEWGCRPVSWKAEKNGRHIFTHVEWDMCCYTVECEEASPAFTWVSAEELENTVSLPTAFRKMLP